MKNVAEDTLEGTDIRTWCKHKQNIMTESVGVELVPGGVGSISMHGTSGSSLFFNETSYLPHEIDWSYINQEWSPGSLQNNRQENADHWTPTNVPAFSWTKTAVNKENLAVTSASQLKGNSESWDISGDSSLFSSSLPSLLKNKLTISETDSCVGQSIDTMNGADEEVFGSLEEMESHTIGNLLPDDEEELLAGIRDEFDVAPYSAEELEDFDLFSSGGGLELEGDSHDIFQSTLTRGSTAGEHPFGEHPSRTLFVRNINSNIEDSELRALFEQYGDIRTSYTACKHRGFVMISYYDIRSARMAMRALQGKPLRRRKLDIHFSIPKDNPSDKDINQGTLVVFNLDASVSNDDLRQIFGVYGEIKEIRETPHKRHHKFIEFYDVRAAEAALRALNRSDIAGKRIKLEPSRPGGARRSLMQQLSQEFDPEESYPAQTAWTNSPPALPVPSSDWGTVNNALDADTAFISPKSTSYRPFSPKATGSQLQDMSSPIKVEVMESHQNKSIRNYFLDQQGTGQQHPHSLPEHNSGVWNSAPVYNSSAGAFSTMATPSSLRPIEGFETRSLTRTTSISNDGSTYGHVNGVHGTAAASLQRSSSLTASLTSQPMLWGGGPYSQGTNSSALMWQSLSPANPYNQRSGESHANLYSSAFSPHSHHFGSYSRSLDRHHSYPGESPELSPFIQSGSFGTMRMGSNVTQPMNGLMNVGAIEHGPSSPNFGMFLPQRVFANGGSPLDDRRNRRVDNTASLQADNKKQFQLDLDRIVSGEDTRTTLMIKNIPNKYNSKMLLAAIDENHRGTYDFIYLPIDFKNKCNVGYAFINMLSPSLIISFYQTFNGKKWEKFNSEKVASLAYGRIQGKAALIAHFQNSSLMNEDKRCRPIIFHSEGPNAGDQEPFPIGDNVRSRSGRAPEGCFKGEFLNPEDCGDYPGLSAESD